MSFSEDEFEEYSSSEECFTEDEYEYVQECRNPDCGTKMFGFFRVEYRGDRYPRGPIANEKPSTIKASTDEQLSKARKLIPSTPRNPQYASKSISQQRFFNEYGRDIRDSYNYIENVLNKKGYNIKKTQEQWAYFAWENNTL